MIEERAYQERTCADVAAHWEGGARSVLVVSPPGSGKTAIAIKTIRARPGKPRVLVIVHTRQLAEQMASRLSEAFGESVSMIMEGHLPIPGARLHVAVVHSLLRREPLRDIDLVILDEAHHYLAEEWKSAQFMLKGKRPLLLGLTATPERDDGQALGDVFQHLVVAAQYSELIAGGWIVPARVIAPKRYLRSNYAQHPVDAWAAHSEGRPTIGFYPLVETAELYNTEFMARDVSACAFHSSLPLGERESAYDSFEQGKCLMLSTVAAAIEGLDVPHCGAVILGRSFQFIGGYLQATGRVLRAHPGKPDGVVIDLTGATVRHGAPDQDREYSLSGKAISGGGGNPNGHGAPSVLPEVLDLELRMTARGALPEGAMPAPVSLPDPDPERLKRALRLKKEMRKLQTRYGKSIAQKLSAELERLVQ